ncbi:AI-2E family transporter [bacterium]|nr:AI-2E family transporter [bacterium]
MNSRWILLLGLTAIMLQLCWRILTPFLSILLWAAVLVLVFYPAYTRVLRQLKGRSTLAAALTTLLVLATIILPMVAVTGAVVTELHATAAKIQGEIPRHMERLPEILEIIYRYTGMDQDELKKAVQTGARTGSESLLQGTLSLVGGAVGFLVNLGFVSFTMFYLFMDGNKAVSFLRDWLPLERSQSHALLVRAGEIISASVYGVVVLAIIQGILGGLAFWFLGLPSPLMWGVVMILFATIPMAGTFVVWVPAAIYLAASGHYAKAGFLTFWGVVVIGMSDNLLRPTLVGKKAKMHDLLIFFAVLGGLRAFGVLGILMGPVVLAVSMTLLEAFRRADPLHAPPVPPSEPLDMPGAVQSAEATAEPPAVEQTAPATGEAPLN